MNAKNSQREQCWVILSEWIEPRPASSLSNEQVAEMHHHFIDDLDAAGLLAGAGPFIDETGARDGIGMVIVRAPTRVEAMTIANREPWIANGFRTFKLKPWQRIAGH
ncbi:MAG TPA: YciI family protein [Xanthobacteraceae bacterium]|jgi:uncharacterized protein YciI|nr:YciI family protein [Xanthobacteraceae bacterium]